MAELKHKRRRRILWPVLAVLFAVLLCGGILLWQLLRPRPMAKDLASAAAPEGALRGLRIGTSEPLAHAAPEALDQYFEDAVQFSLAHGLNAVFLDIVNEADGIGFRDKTYATWEGSTAEDTLTERYDPLRALCERAAEAGLSVYAVTPEIPGNEEWEESLARMRKMYAVAGLYIESDTLSDADTGTPVLYASGDDFAAPQHFFAAMAGVPDTPAVYEYALCTAQPDMFSLLASCTAKPSAVPHLTDFVPLPSLSVSYPADGAKIYTETCFVMGTSDPAKPLTLNGQPVESRADGGTFGMLVTLAQGENTLTLTQGGTPVQLTVTRPAPSGWGGGKRQNDDTRSVPEGSFITTTGWISSLLYDPAGDGNISETVRQGATARVAECARTVRGGKNTWAYKLESGDWILARNTVPAEPAQPVFSFTGAAAVQTADGETVTFAGSGTPLAYTNMVAGELVMDFYDAQFSPDFAVSGSEMISAVRCEALDTHTRVTFSFREPAQIWGHTVEYKDGTTQILLNKAPVRSDVFSKPLTGVKVLLDAGHGDQDTGAMGAAGAGAPAEKDVNLALMSAAKYRLEQMGATVQTIRTDDTFVTLDGRNRAIIEMQPDFFISLHHNSIALSVDAAGAFGTECYYFYPAGKQLAETLVNEVTAATGRRHRGAHWGYYYVTRSTVCPAVLFEGGFMVNPYEYEQLVRDDQLWAAGDAIARSILACVPEG